jgi:hypothetical protein
VAGEEPDNGTDGTMPAAMEMKVQRRAAARLGRRGVHAEAAFCMSTRTEVSSAFAMYKASIVGGGDERRCGQYVDGGGILTAPGQEILWGENHGGVGNM